MKKPVSNPVLETMVYLNCHHCKKQITEGMYGRTVLPVGVVNSCSKKCEQEIAKLPKFIEGKNHV